jgi:hypothetical protein
MKHWPTQKAYLTVTFLVAGFIPNSIAVAVYLLLPAVGWVWFGLGLFGVRIIPRFCDAWVQTSYPKALLLIEVVNGFILSLVTAGVLAAVSSSLS